MPLNAATLKTALASDLETKIRTAQSLGSTPYPELTSFCNAIADAVATQVVSHIQTNATIGVTIAGTTANNTDGLVQTHTHPSTGLTATGTIS